MNKPVRSAIRSSFTRFETFAPQRKVKTVTTWRGPNRPSGMKAG